jgi:hypothetical protein
MDTVTLSELNLCGKQRKDRGSQSGGDTRRSTHVSEVCHPTGIEVAR